MPRRDQHIPWKQHKVFDDLEQLAKEPGFVYSLCLMIARSLLIHPNDFADINWFERPNQAELSLLLGILVKRHIRLDYTPSQEEVLDQSIRATTLLAEMHRSVSPPAILRQNTVPSDHRDFRGFLQDYDTWMRSGQGVVEPIFYGGEGAYEFQYLDMASAKYASDEAWIKANMGSSVEVFIKAANDLRHLLSHRIRTINQGMTVEEECEAVLSAMTFDLKDFPATSRETLEHFIAAFSCSPGEVNQSFKTLADYNVAISRPIVALGNGGYLVPILYNIPRAIYENPFYWMMEDDNYRDTALEHRGDSNESVTHDILAPIFGSDAVFRGVKVTDGRRDITDIDVLAVSGNKAMIAQCKSKKLTIDARHGDETAIRNDFKKAVQDSYEQATTAGQALMGGHYRLYDGTGTPVQLPTEIDETYILCITGDHYPAVITQASIYLQKGEQDPHPIILSVFDLDLVGYYLHNRYELLYYLRQRAAYASHFAADSEISLLGFHLRHKLFPDLSSEITYIDSGYGQLVDANFLAAKADWPPSEASERLFHTWNNRAFSELLEDIITAARRGPSPILAEDLIFFMYDLAGEGADNLIRCTEEVKRQTLLDRRKHSARVPMNQRKSGVTIVSFPPQISTRKVQDIERELRAVSFIHKYMSKADEWMTIASFEGSPFRFDFVSYTKDLWKKDPKVEEWIKEHLSGGRKLRINGNETR